jgi:hypothetical protein
MIDSGEIVDGKTIMLLQYAALHGLVRQRVQDGHHQIPHSGLGRMPDDL